MRFQVPQFIDIEDRIFGPFTIKQFIYMGGGLGMAFLLWRFLPLFWLFKLIIIVPFTAFALLLAFYKVNNKPFIYILQSAIKYMLGSKLYIWKKVPPKLKKGSPSEGEKDVLGLYVPKLSDSKLKDLTWSLDINENVSPGSNETMSQK